MPTPKSGNYLWTNALYRCAYLLITSGLVYSVQFKCELVPDEVNIIVGNSEENDKKISKIGKGFSRGRLPLKGEPHKKFTFCTSTAFAGCDFYSTVASSFAICDPYGKGACD